MKGYAAQQAKDRGLSEVIGFVMLLGVVIAAMALWMMYVVPVEGRENEITQMNAVKDRFTDYKISLDSLWINSPYGATYSESGVTLSTNINLGTAGSNTQGAGVFLPLLKPIAASGVLSVVDTGDYMNITSNGGSTDMIRNYSLRKMVYQSENNYWIQQKYFYQAGGVFLSQDTGATTRVAPPISIVNSSGKATSMNDFTATVDITPITLDGGGSIGGNGPVRVDSRMKTVQTVLQEKKYWANISVKVADHTSALMWKNLFIDALNNESMTNLSWYTVGNTSPSAAKSFAWVYIKGPYNDNTYQDVWLTIRPVEYAVTFNNIASGIS